MKFNIRGKNLEVTPGLRTAIEKKLSKLDKYFTPDTMVYVTLRIEKESQIIEVTIPVKGGTIRSEQASSDMYVTIDLVEEIIERQLRKYKTRLIARNHGSHDFQAEFMEEDDDAPSDDQEIRIVRTKKFGFKPMYPEDACLEMELLGHSFYVFCNADTDDVNVVYKRKNGTYGLIEPEF